MGYLDKSTNLYHDNGELDLVDEEAWSAKRAPQLPGQFEDEKYDDELDQYLLESGNEDESDAAVGEKDDQDNDLGDLLLAELERDVDEEGEDADLGARLLAEFEGDAGDDLSQRSLSAGATLSAAASATLQAASKPGSLKRKAEFELNASEEGGIEGQKGRMVKALKKESKSSAGSSTLTAEAAPQFDLDGLLANGNLPRSGRAAKSEAIEPALRNGSHDHAPTTQKSAGPIPCPAPEDLGLDRLSDAGMAQAVRSNTLARAYSNEEKKAFLKRKTGQSQYRLRKESLEAEIRRWYHTTYEPYLAANRPHEERKAKRRAKLAARKASSNDQSTLDANGKTVIVLDDTEDDDDDDCAPPALGAEEHERVRQALRGAFGKSGKHSFSFSNAPAAGRVSQASGPIGISKTSAPPAVASKPRQKRKKKEVVAVDSITDEEERAELQRAQMALYDAARAALASRAEDSDRQPSLGSEPDLTSTTQSSNHSQNGDISRQPEAAASQAFVEHIDTAKTEKIAATPVRNASPAVIDLTTPPYQQPSSPPYRPQSPIYRNAPSILQSSSPAMGDPFTSYQTQSPGYRPFSPSFAMVDVFADNTYIPLLGDEELRGFGLLADQ